MNKVRSRFTKRALILKEKELLRRDLHTQRTEEEKSAQKIVGVQREQ